MSEMERAQERMNSAYKAFDYARKNTNNAAAELARLTLLKIAAETPGLEGMVFESEYQYDDQGGYFQSVSCYPAWGENGPERDEDEYYEFMDQLSGFGVEALTVLCDVAGDSTSGEITIEKAKAARF